MLTEPLFYQVVYLWIAVALVMFPLILRIVVPYGRHTNKNWGPLLPNRLGWMIMEAPALLVFSGFFLFSSSSHPPVTWIFFLLFNFHYVNRTIIFPFRLRTKGKKMPMIIVMMGMMFNVVNGYLNGYFLGSLAEYPAGWVTDIRFFGGIIIYLSGMLINWQADNILIHLRKPGETGYVIPQGGFFKYVSCPNHMGEILEWSGFALMTWSLPGLAFAVWTLVNLLPRALHHHRWYQEHFSDYPSNRKAIFPFIL